MNTYDLQEIGKRISERRKQTGITQEQLAEKMNVSVQMISNLERGNKAIKIDNLIKLSQILDMSTDFILLGKHSDSDITAVAKKLSLLDERDYKTVNLLIECMLN